MKLCFITPISCLNLYALQSQGVHLALVDQVQKSSKYADFYRGCSERGDFIILDNGTFEFGKPCETGELLEAADRIKAHTLVAPDFPAEDWRKTVESTAEFAASISHTNYKVFGCPQSAVGDIEGWTQAIDSMARIPTLSHIGISILACPNAFGPLVGDRSDIELCRFTATQWLKMAIKQGLDLRGKKLHYLGGGHRIDLIRHYDIADSLDTSSPVWHGYQLTKYESGFLPHGKTKVPVDFNAPFPTVGQIHAIEHNMSVIKEHAAVAESRRQQA